MLTLKQLRLVINQTTGHMNMLTWWWCYMTLADLSSGDIKCLWWLTSVSHHNRSTQLSDPIEPVTPDKQSSGKESPEVWKHHAVVLQRFLGCIRPVETTVSYWPIRSDGCWFRFRLVSWTCLSMKLYKHSCGSFSFVSHREFCCNLIGLKRCGLRKQQQCEAPVAQSSFDSTQRSSLGTLEDVEHNGPGNVNKTMKWHLISTWYVKDLKGIWIWMCSHSPQSDPVSVLCDGFDVAETTEFCGLLWI